MNNQPQKSTNHQPKPTNAQITSSQFLQPISDTQSQSLSGGLVLLFANPFA